MGKSRERGFSSDARRKYGSFPAPLVAYRDGTHSVHRFCQIAPHGAQYESRNLPLGHQGQICRFARKFATTIKLQSRFAKELGGETHILGPVHSPEPQFFLVALQEVQALFELFHAAIK